MLTYDNDVPEWIKSASLFYERAFGLTTWKIHVVMADSPGGDSSYAGATYLSTKYRQARIEYLRKMVEETDEFRQMVAHEMFHVVLGLVDESVDTLVHLFVPSESADTARRIYSNAEEATIELFVRAIDEVFVEK